MGGRIAIKKGVMDADRHQQFAERVVRNQQRVFRYLVTLVPNRADAEELFQQTCLTRWENWERYDTALDFVPWACGIAHNHVRNFHRKRQNSQVLLDADVVELLSERAQEMQRSEDDKLAALRNCLAALTEGNRKLVEAYYGGRTVQELAALRAATPNAVYKMLHRIRETLHDCILLRLSGAAE
jgi:RNA polymerase sigma-70 factor (ECF subfamily)